ncbi:MAG TPA: fructose-6-phosphate aldolase [Deltaproteobacteria bacterium]|nr:fructose-6-phosphate aldolase [Deltaproteobacteria bacterium]HCP46488.1 fructose-6-phosphate aldolase [Deltaproteobacteria bacterium]
MKLFIDTANIDEIKEAASWGILDGCTTNPSLIAREGRDFAAAVHEICEIVQGPVSAEVVAQDADGMLEEAALLRQIHPHVVIKLPMSHEGLKACRALSDEGTPVNMTLIFSVNQAVLAAKAGAAYVSPFIGRIDDTGQDGIAVLSDIIDVFNTYYFETEVLAASIRHTAHALDAARLGSHVSTMPFKVMKAMAYHPLTDKGNAAFLADWAKVPGDGLIPTVERFLATRQKESA